MPARVDAGGADEGRSDRKRRVILEAATDLFLRNGYLGTSMDEVASVAGVSKQTVYKHFSDKEGLFQELVLATIDQVGEPFYEALPSLEDTDDVEEDLRALARGLIRIVMRPRLLQLRRLVIAEAGRFPELSGPYLGQKPPGPTPEIFAPGIISTGRFERDVAMSPGGDEMYFGASGPGYLYTTVLATRLVNGRWTEPEIVPHLDDPRHLNLEPALSPDGSRLFFLSTRPNAAAGAARNQDIWVMTKTADGWSEPENLGAPVNTDLAEYFPSITRDNTIYFTREEPGSRVSHIWRARLAGGRYQAAEKLPAQVNSGRSQFNAFIAPDESYLIVPVDGRDDSIGGCDYYVVFRTPDDRWSEPINLGPTVNSEGSQEFSPYVSPDGKYFFYMATRLDRPERLSYQLIRDLHGRPRNGNADIYWVDAGVVTSLRSKAVFK